MVSKSEASKTWRISISYSPLGTGSGQRLTHSSAASAFGRPGADKVALNKVAAAHRANAKGVQPGSGQGEFPRPRGCEATLLSRMHKLTYRVPPVHLDFSQNPAAHLVPIGFAYDRLGQAGHPGRDAAASLSGAAGRT